MKPVWNPYEGRQHVVVGCGGGVMELILQTRCRSACGRSRSKRRIFQVRRCGGGGGGGDDSVGGRGRRGGGR